MEFPSQVVELIRQPIYPLVFATISGAHLYGFASADSDYDLRGVHVLPVREVASLYPGSDTLSLAEVRDGVEMDMVTHDVQKFFLLMLKKNGYVLEQLYSPLVVHTTPEHEELKAIGERCITRHHVHHYLGFAKTQWTLFEKESPPRVKPLLYVYRVLLTGLHLMRTGRIEADLGVLQQIYPQPGVTELITRKLAGREKSTLSEGDVALHHSAYGRLSGELEHASEASALPDNAIAKPALSDLLLRLRGL